MNMSKTSLVALPRTSWVYIFGSSMQFELVFLRKKRIHWWNFTETVKTTELPEPLNSLKDSKSRFVDSRARYPPFAAISPSSVTWSPDAFRRWGFKSAFGWHRTMWSFRVPMLCTNKYVFRFHFHPHYQPQANSFLSILRECWRNLKPQRNLKDDGFVWWNAILFKYFLLEKNT